jgi:hypothetical protein
MNHLDLFQNAFTELADVSKGIINVNWEWTKCPIDSPLQAHMKSGVSPFWFSVQIVNANKVSSGCKATGRGRLYGSLSLDSVLQTSSIAPMEAKHGRVASLVNRTTSSSFPRAPERIRLTCELKV